MAQVKAFPGMPATSAKLLKMLKNPESSAAQIEEILKYDPGLTANILKLTNSAYFGIPTKVSSVKQAIILLGWKRLLQLVMTMCMSTVMKKPLPGYDLPHGELWRHSVAVSVAAELVVNALKIPGADEVFTAALLHDIGKLILGDFVRDDFKKIESILSQGISFETAENMILGVNHADIGAEILRKWSLPAELVSAVRWHHNPEFAEQTDSMLDIVHVANVLCRMIGVSSGRDGLQYQPSELAVERLGLTSHQLEKVVSQTIQWVEELSDFMATD